MADPRRLNDFIFAALPLRTKTMNRAKVIAPIVSAALICLANVAYPEVPEGWKTVLASEGLCKMSVPPDWSADRNVQGHMNAPGWGGATILPPSSGSSVNPMDKNKQNILNVGKMFENTKQRIFYVGRPSSASPPTLSYHVEVAIKGGSCVAQIDVRAAFLESAIKGIAASVSAAK
jgi:hypothetical protein